MNRSYDYSMRELMINLIKGALAETGGNKTEAAKILRMNRTRMSMICKKYFPEVMRKTPEKEKK